MKWLYILTVAVLLAGCVEEPATHHTQDQAPVADEHASEGVQFAERLEDAQLEPGVQEKAVQENPIVWKESANGLTIGVQQAGELTLEVYFENRGSAEIFGVIQYQARFIIELNGKYYAMADYGGPTSWMPPGRSYGPVKIDTSRFWEIPKLRQVYTMEPNDSHPVLRAGRNSIRLHYKLENELIPSAEIIVDN